MDEVRAKLLLVEDDVELARMIVAYLDDAGFDVTWLTDGAAAIAHASAETPDIIVLDVMLPKVDGMEVCRRVRPDCRAPILMLTAKDDDLVEVTSLGLGADGYLTKPVRPRVLLAHVQALLRRAAIDDERAEDRWVVQDLVVDAGAMRLEQAGREVTLTTAEFELLSLLAGRAGTVVSRDEVYRHVRGIEYDGCDRSIDMRVSTLRRKMLDDRPPYRYIKTVRGKGYLMPRT